MSSEALKTRAAKMGALHKRGGWPCKPSAKFPPEVRRAYVEAYKAEERLTVRRPATTAEKNAARQRWGAFLFYRPV